MAKGTQARYSIELDFTTGKAEQSVKAATDKIKERLNSIATEANKTKYFEGLIGDIRDVDTQLTQLKEKHGKDFESIYQGIGEGARQEFELVFAYARSETEKFYAEIKAKQAEFSGLQQIQNDYKKYSKSATQAISGAYITGFGKSMDATQVQNMYNSFDKLLAKKAEFEKVGNTSSKEYLENYVQILKTASGLIKADAEVANDDKDFGIDVEALYNMAEKAKSILNSLDINGFASRLTDATNLVKTNLKEQMKSFAEEMPNRIKSAFGKIDDSSFDEEVSQYNELNKKLQEYYELKLKLKNVKKKSAEWYNINDRQRAIQDEIYAMKELSEEQEDAFYNLFDSLDENDNLQLNDAVIQFCNILKIDIPNGAAQAANAATSAFTKITKGAEQASDASQKVMYHLGNLLGGKKARDTFDQMPYNLTEAAIGTRLEEFGFGVLGGGLFGVTNPATIDQNPAGSRFIQSIDLSKYNMYMADTEERAIALIDFLSKLQKFSIKGAEPNYTGFDQQLNGVNVDSLYQQFKELFAQSDLTKEKFESFINDMVALLQQAGLKFDENTGILDFTSIGKLEGTANISTKFMKMLGYQGVNVGTTSFDGLGQGSVLFDFDPSDVVGYFNTIDQAIKDYENITKQLDGNQWVGTIEQLQQYKQNIDEIINRIQEFKSTPIGQADSQNLEKTLSRLEQIKTKVDGAIVGNNESPFIQITESTDKVGTSIDEASTKLKEFLALTEEIRTKNFDYYGNAEDNIEVGKYTERLTTAKAALDELGDQGILTAEQLNQVQEAFNRANSNLVLSTSHYSGYGDGYYDYSYYDEYKEQQNRANELEAHNRDLQEQLNNVQKTSAEQIQNAQYSAEIAQLDQLKEKLAEVKQAVDLKTQAFKEEYVTVDAAVDAEVRSLQLLLNQLQEVLKQINLISEGFTKTNAEIAELHNIKDVDIKENITSETTDEKAAETISQNYALDSTLTETNGILGQILTTIGNNESIKGLVDPLTSAVAELKNVANGIIEHQKAQRTDLTDSSTRIANNYGQLSSITGNVVTGLGENVQIENMKALADNIVRVRGAVQDAGGVWKGFVVDIDESNKAVIRAIDEQSAFAKSLNETANAVKNAGVETKSQEAPAQDGLTKKIYDQTNAINKYRDSIKDVKYVSTDLREELDNLALDLKTITDESGLKAWKDSFSNVKKEITLAKDTFTAQQVGKVNQAKNALDDSFKKTGLKENDSNLTDEQQKIVNGYTQAKAILEAYGKSAQRSNQIELSALQNVTNELYQQIEAYKQKNNIVDGRKKTYGDNAIVTAKGKYNSLSQIAKNEFVDSNVVQNALNQYTTAYQKLIDKQKEYKAGQELNTDQKVEFKQLQTECNKYATELNKLITANKKFEESAQSVTKVDEDFEDSTEGRMKALQDFVQVQYGAEAEIGEFNAACEKLTFTIDNGNGTFTQMTAAINPARNAIGAIAGDTKKATSAFGQFFNELKGKFRTIFTYLISSFSLQEVWQQIRQGVNYVREIDSALTELKKVTDETDATYEQFLQTASKTAGVIGSTVADFTNATADFARLGYNIEQASKLAEAASVYKNVGDGIDDVATASESIISTMKAFGIEAEDAMGIVDRFNEIGNNFAISSTGIGEALQRSASALYEAGNTIDESISLITAANSVVQNPEQVGEMLADIT